MPVCNVDIFGKCRAKVQSNMSHDKTCGMPNAEID